MKTRKIDVVYYEVTAGNSRVRNDVFVIEDGNEEEYNRLIAGFIKKYGYSSVFVENGTITILRTRPLQTLLFLRIGGGLMTEVWRNIEWYPYYQVSNFGRIRSFWIPEHGLVLDEPYICDLLEIGDGVFVEMGRSDYHGVVFGRRRLDKLVAGAFCKRDDGAYCVRHLDGDEHNCRASNLEWFTPERNKYEIPVLALKTLTHEETWFSSVTEASKSLGIAQSTISNVLRGRGHSAKGYEFRYATESVDRRARFRLGIKAININTGEEILFSNQSDAAKFLGIRQPNISLNLKGKIGRVGDWRFEYS